MALFIPKDRKSLFRQFLAGMYDAVVITDPNGHILEINPRTVEYFGRSQDEVLDMPVSVFIPGLRQEVVERIRRGLAGDRHVVIDANAVSKEGAKIACEVAVSAIDLMSPGDLIFTIRNVERRRAYLSALTSRANAFAASTAALFACDADGTVRECNGAFLRLFGLKDAGDARRQAFSELMEDAPLLENFTKAMDGATTTAVIAVGVDGAADEKYEVVLAPDVRGRKIQGVVGSIVKV